MGTGYLMKCVYKFPHPPPPPPSPAAVQKPAHSSLGQGTGCGIHRHPEPLRREKQREPLGAMRTHLGRMLHKETKWQKSLW